MFYVSVQPVHARTNAKLYKHSTQKSVLNQYWTVGLQLIYSTGPVRSTRRWTVRSLIGADANGDRLPAAAAAVAVAFVLLRFCT